MNDQREDAFDMTSDMNSTWGGEYDLAHPSQVTFDDVGIPILGDYLFGEVTRRFPGFTANYCL
jgi:hypothetical protein